MIPLLLLIGTALCVLAVAVTHTGERASRGLRGASLAALAVSAAAFCYAAGPFEVRKVAGACAMPAGIVWLAWVALAFTLGRRGRMKAAAAAWCLWLAYGAAGNVWVAQALMGWLESGYAETDPLKVAPFDAVLVLGGGLDVRPNGQIFLADSGDRVALGARMANTDRTSTLITSGPFWRPPEMASSIPELTSIMWQQLGVEAEQIVLLEGPLTTGEEMKALAELMATRPWRRVGVLSSACHLRRAMRLARRHDLQVIPLPADFRSTHHAIRPTHLIPQGYGFANVHRACWEIVGAAVVR